MEAVEVFSMGHLLDRYFTEVRSIGSPSVDVEEAVVIRSIIDRALQMTFTADLVVPDEPCAQEVLVDDQRDRATRMIDQALLSTAKVPSLPLKYLLRRIDASFDRAVVDWKESCS